MGSGWLRVLVSGSGPELRFRGSGWSPVPFLRIVVRGTMIDGTRLFRLFGPL